MSRPESMVRARFGIRHLWLLLPGLALAVRAVNPIKDNSFLWHVRAGEAQLAGGEVLRADPFSFTEHGTPWRTQSWLIELAYGRLYELTGGVQWVPAMIFLVMGTTIVFVGLAVYRRVRDPLRTGAALLVVTWVAFLFAVPRPVLLSFLFLAVLVVVLQNAERVGWVVVPLLWLWAAVHGSWVVGGGLLALEALRSRSRRLFELGAIAAVATLLTAHGVGAWQVFFSFLANRDALAYLSEWDRPDFSNPFLMPALLVLALIVFAFARKRLSVGHLIVVVPFAAFGVLQLRSVFPAMLVLVPYAAAAVATGRAGGSGPRGSAVVNGGIAAALVALMVVSLARPVRFDHDKLPPPAAVAALAEGPVFQAPAAGGYLIYAAWPERLVFIDDRAELFGASGFERVVAALEGREYEAVFEAFGIEQALLEVDWPLVEKLEDDGWTATYRDAHWVVMASR